MHEYGKMETARVSKNERSAELVNVRPRSVTLPINLNLAVFLIRRHVGPPPRNVPIMISNNLRLSLGTYFEGLQLR